MWATLISVIVGAVIGAIPALIAPRIVHKLNEEAYLRKLRRDRAEQLMAAVYDHHDWINVVRDISLFSREGPEPPSPMSKVHTLILLHFPGLKTEFAEFKVAAIEYRRWILTKQDDKVSSGSFNVEGFEAVYKTYTDQLDCLLDCVIQELVDSNGERTGTQKRSASAWFAKALRGNTREIH